MYQRIDGERLGKMLLEIPLEFRIGTLYRQIADHLEKMILAGSIPCGARLPGTRELARTLGTLPGHCHVRAIEAERFDLGAGLSPPVAAAVDEVVEGFLADLALEAV